MIRTFAQLLDAVRSLDPIRPAVAAAGDDKVLGGLKKARLEGIIDRPILTGAKARIAETLRALGEDPADYDIVDAPSDASAAVLAVEAVRDGRAGMLVKGSLKTMLYLKAILDRERGLRASKSLSNMSLFEMASYHKLVGVTDNAIVPLPDLEQKQASIENTRPLWKALGVERPKVAALAGAEIVQQHLPATVDAACLTVMALRGQIEGFDVDGPLGYDAAMSRDCAESKRIGGLGVAGDPDLLLAPNLEAANILGKSYKLHGQASWGGLVLGGIAPIVLNSRSDGDDNRLRSMLMARAVAEHIPSAGRRS